MKLEWISTTIGLPGDFIDILFIVNRDQDQVCYGFMQCDDFIELNQPDDMIRHDRVGVTHWMPLPEPPK